MIWLFERGEEVVRLETRIDHATGEYVVDIKWASRAAETERYRDAVGFERRMVELEQQLASDQWTQAGTSPRLLPHGWRGPIPH